MPVISRYDLFSLPGREAHCDIAVPFFVPCVIVLFAVALAAFSEAMVAAVCSCARVAIVATGAAEKQQLQEQAPNYSFSILLLLFS